MLGNDTSDEYISLPVTLDRPSLRLVTWPTVENVLFSILSFLFNQLLPDRGAKHKKDFSSFFSIIHPAMGQRSIKIKSVPFP